MVKAVCEVLTQAMVRTEAGGGSARKVKSYI